MYGVDFAGVLTNYHGLLEILLNIEELLYPLLEINIKRDKFIAYSLVFMSVFDILNQILVVIFEKS